MFQKDYVHRSNILGAGLIAFIAGAVAWALFGRKVSDKIGQNEEFQNLKKQVYDKASQISDLTQDKYDSVVDEVTNKYAQVKGISSNELRDLADDLKWHWRRIKSSWKNNRYSGFGDGSGFN
ncbi:MAG: hypothetical protein KW788_00575 [Candidatus Doudnabacteria bacterium]|nr:hypothetical protein [Candidatus Doudnabacteria bacterium]